MPRGENGWPVTPEWSCDPRPCILDNPALCETAEAVDEPHLIRGTE